MECTYHVFTSVSRVSLKVERPKLNSYANAYTLMPFTPVRYPRYNLGHNILKLYKVLVEIRLTTSKMKRKI